MSERFMQRAIAILVGVAVWLTYIPTALSDTTELKCAGGRKAIGYLGISGFECKCTLATGDEVLDRWSFHSEPRILSIDPNGPCAGQLQVGDAIVAIGGQLITTNRGGEIFSAPTPGLPLEITVRRDDRIIERTVLPEAVCPDDPRVSGSSPSPAPQLPRHANVVQSARPEPPDRFDTEPVPEIAALDLLPEGWLGLGIECSDCGFERNAASKLSEWHFELPPSVYSVDPGSPAERAGMLQGDLLTHIDGIALDSDEGGRRFSNIRPQQEIVWTIVRDGVVKKLRSQAGPPPFARAPRPEGGPQQALAGRHKLRFAGNLGATDVKVWGVSSVVVTVDDAKGQITIETGDATIRLRAP